MLNLNKDILEKSKDKYKGFHEDLNSCCENYKECFTFMRSNMKRTLLRKQGYTTKDKEYYSDN